MNSFEKAAFEVFCAAKEMEDGFKKIDWVSNSLRFDD